MAKDRPAFANPEAGQRSGNAPAAPKPAESRPAESGTAAPASQAPAPQQGGDSEAMLTMQCMETFFDILVQCWNEFDKAKLEHKDTKRLLNELSDILMKGDYGSTVAMAASLIQRQGRELPASYHEAARLAQRYQKGGGETEGDA